jgi:predicted Zn-dependent protease
MAQTQLEEIKKSKPTIAEDFIDLSEFYFEQNNFSEAIKILNKGIKKFPQQNCLYLKKAEILFLTKQIQKAQEVLEKLKKINND